MESRLFRVWIQDDMTIEHNIIHSTLDGALKYAKELRDTFLNHLEYRAVVVEYDYLVVAVLKPQETEWTL